MVKFADLLKGTRARRSTKLPLLAGPEVDVDLLLLNGADQASLLEAAIKRAQKAGVAEPREGHPIFAFAIDTELVARCVAVVGSDPVKPELFFADGDEVLQGLDRERITFMAVQQRHFQESVSPSVGKRSVEEYWAHIVVAAEAADDDELPFERWPLHEQRDYVRFSAKQLLISLSAKSSPASTSSESVTE